MPGLYPRLTFTPSPNPRHFRNIMPVLRVRRQSVSTQRPKKYSAVTKATAVTAPIGVPTQLAISRISPIIFLLYPCCCCSSRDPRAYTSRNGTPLVPNAFSSQAIILAKRLFEKLRNIWLAVAGYFPGANPMREPKFFRGASSA
jgi:hypothetical protein